MNAVAEMLLTDPATAVIWAALVLITFPAMIVLGSPDVLRHPRRAARELAAVLRRHGVRERLRAAEAGQTTRYAGQVRVAADRAAAGALRWHELWEKSGDDLNAAHQSWLDADDRVRTAVAAAAWGPPWSVRTCDEYAARERFLHTTVAAVAGRGELPAAAVVDALAGRRGWDARLHPVEQELVVARASAAWLRDRYKRAVTAELTTRHDAELARRASSSLALEARTATAAAARLGGPRPVRVRAAAPASRRAVAMRAI